MTTAATTFVTWFASRLKKSGLQRAFGVPGGGTSLDLLEALSEQGVETVITAREDAAVIMAGVSGILSDSPGVAFTTKGPGLASATNGLASAALDRMPALLISEAFSEDELKFLSHQVFSHADLVEPLLKEGEGDALAADQVGVENWLERNARAPAVMFPTSKELNQSVSARVDPAAKSELVVPDIDQAVKLVGEAKHPVVIVGLEAARSAVSTDLRAFVDKLGGPVLCTYMAKGCIADDDPHFAGIFTGGAIEQACMNAADLIVLVGLDPVELIRKPWGYAAPVLDLCERVYDPHYLTPAARIVAPLMASLKALGDKIETSSWNQKDIAVLRTGFLQGMAEGGAAGLSSASVVKAIRDAFPDRPRLSVDAGAHMFSACAFWPTSEPRDLLISNGLATMGFAVPAAIAAALHDPSRGAIAITGDGGLLMCLGELKTAAETGTNITIIVFNDGRLSLIDIKREDRQMPDLGLSWTPPDFAAIASGFGFSAWQVNDADELPEILVAAAGSSGPRLVDIRIDDTGYRDQMRALRG